MAYAVLAVPEMEAFVRVLTEGGPGRLPDAAERALHARLHGYLQPAIDRFLPWRMTSSGRSSVRRCGTTRGRTR